jgi:hypothetical protein
VLAKNAAGVWQMMESYHNYVLASPVMTATQATRPEVTG